MKNEIWKYSLSFPDILVSSLGRILLPEVTRPMPNGGFRKIIPKPSFGYISKSNKSAKYVYLSYWVRRYGHLKIHKLVCEAFHGVKPFEKAVVIHIDENSLNNKAENLKWGTQKENLNGVKFIEYCSKRTGANSPVRKGKLKKEAR